MDLHNLKRKPTESSARQFWYEVQYDSNTEDPYYFGVIEGEGVRLLAPDGRLVLRIKWTKLSHFTVKGQHNVQFKNRLGNKKIAIQFFDVQDYVMCVNRIRMLVHNVVQVIVNCRNETKFVIHN